MLERVVHVKRVERMGERDGQKRTFERGSVGSGHMQTRDVENSAQQVWKKSVFFLSEKGSLVQKRGMHVTKWCHSHARNQHEYRKG